MYIEGVYINSIAQTPDLRNPELAKTNLHIYSLFVRLSLSTPSEHIYKFYCSDTGFKKSGTHKDEFTYILPLCKIELVHTERAYI